jgi:hypothetical protein
LLAGIRLLRHRTLFTAATRRARRGILFVAKSAKRGEDAKKKKKKKKKLGSRDVDLGSDCSSLHLFFAFLLLLRGLRDEELPSAIARLSGELVVAIGEPRDEHDERLRRC